MDFDHLKLEERNLFTATELATVMPMYGLQEYDQLIEQNPWLSSFYPNFQSRRNESMVSQVWPTFKKTMEFLLDNRVGNFLDDKFMKIVRRKYNRKAGSPYSKEELDVMFKLKKHVSKIHHGNHQHQLLTSLDERRKEFENKFGFELTNLPK